MSNDEGGLGISAPLFIAARGVDAHRGTEMVTLVWLRDGRWQTAVVDRALVANTRTVVELASSGLPVTTLTARTVVQYLDEFESANLKHLPVTRLSHKMGWQGNDGADGFLWGRTLITDKSVFKKGGEKSDQRVQFRATDTGDGQLADGFRRAGSFKKWLRVVELVRQHPRALFGLYAAFVPPMLAVLKAFNCVIDFAGDNTSGKTTELRVIASVWGDPDERNAGAVLKTWNSTATWRERVTATCSHVPLVLDDTKNVTFPDEVAKTIYSVVQGRGKGRGTVSGVAEQDSCVTVLFSSGEQPATSFTKDGGTRPRVLSFWGAPLGKVSPKMAARIRRINRLVFTNYGHAGPRFVRYLLQNSDDWATWRDWYEEYVKYYEERAGQDAVAARMATHFAAVAVTSYVAHEALELPWEWADPVKPVWAELTCNSGEADVAGNALRLTVNWAIARRESFFHRNAPTSQQPPGGWLGRWERDGQVKWPWVGIFPHVLETLLRDNEFDPGATLRSWRQRGWIEVDGSGKGRNTKRAQIGRDLGRVVAIRRSAFEAVMQG